MSYNDKYPDMSAMYAVQFEYENKLKDKTKELETELERTRKALDVAVDALDTVRQYYRGTAVIRPHNIAAYCDNKIDKIKEITALEQKEEQ